MERHALITMAVVSAAAVFCACGDSPGIGDFTDQDYFPFAPANAWTYERFGQLDTLGLTYSFNGNAIVSVQGVEEQASGDLIQLFTAGTDTLYGEGVDSLFIPLGGASFARMNDQGVWLYTDTLMTDSVQVAQFPLSVGDTWLYSVDPEATAEVIAMDEVVTVPDGEFDDVLHIRVTQGDIVSITQDDFYAPGIGNIMSTMTVLADSAVVYEMTQQMTHHMLF